MKKVGSVVDFVGAADDAVDDAVVVAVVFIVVDVVGGSVDRGNPTPRSSSKSERGKS
jgi:hypothetical protein